MTHQRRGAPFVRGAIYDVRQPRTCPKCGGIMEKGDRMVADSDTRAVHYDPPCKGDPVPLPVMPRPLDVATQTYGQDWPSLPWHYIARVRDNPLGYIAVCGAKIRAVRDGARVLDAPGWPSAYHCSACEAKGPPNWRLIP